jgi:fused signal recognition particle receptor
MSLFEKIKAGLSKTRENMSKQVDMLVKSFTRIDEDLLEELTETLIIADMGVETAENVIELLRKRIKESGATDPALVRQLLRDVIAEMLGDAETELNLSTKPSVLVMVGVNGVGKTTSIAKIAHMLGKQNRKVVLAAADTFRAGAIDQLEVWAQRAGVEMIRHSQGSDPAAVVFDAIAAAKARGADVLLCDTAGRLHNKKNLMDELNKISRVIQRELPDSAVETLLVLDATTGQNALAQAASFREVTPVTGIVLTKLDGTSRGGIVLPIFTKLKIPVKFIGVGEQMDDLQPFDAETYADALFD